MHQVGGDGRVDGAAAIAQDVDAGQRGQIVRRGDHAVGAVDGCAKGICPFSRPPVWPDARRSACTTLMATSRPVRGLSSVGILRISKRSSPNAPSATTSCMVAVDVRVGDDAHLGAIEADAGQADRRGYVDTFGKAQRAFAGAAAEQLARRVAVRPPRRPSRVRAGLRVVWVTRVSPPTAAAAMASSPPMAPETTIARLWSGARRVDDGPLDSRIGQRADADQHQVDPGPQHGRPVRRQRGVPADFDDHVLLFAEQLIHAGADRWQIVSALFRLVGYQRANKFQLILSPNQAQHASGDCSQSNEPDAHAAEFSLSAARRHQR